MDGGGKGGRKEQKGFSLRVISHKILERIRQPVVIFFSLKAKGFSVYGCIVLYHNLWLQRERRETHRVGERETIVKVFFLSMTSPLQFLLLASFSCKNYEIVVFHKNSQSELSKFSFLSSLQFFTHRFISFEKREKIWLSLRLSTRVMLYTCERCILQTARLYIDCS